MSDENDTTISIVSAARIFAVTSYEPLVKQFPQLESLVPAKDLPKWDFLMTVAAVGTAVLGLPYEVGSPRDEALEKLVYEGLASWNKDGPPALADFLEFTAKGARDGLGGEDAIGTWVLLNLRAGTPTNDDLSLARPIGTYLASVFRTWWSETKGI